MAEKIKIIIVDDHEIFRNGLQIILGRIEIVKLVGTATNGFEFLELLKSIEADIVLMDIKMPVIDGIEATKKAMEINPNLKVIALSMFGDEEYLQQMIQAGVKGFLLKNITRKDLNHAIELVNRGGNYYSEELLGFFTKKYIHDTHPEDDDLQITKRELEVLQLVAEGLTNQEIADKLFISKRTVDGHKNNLIGKTGIKKYGRFTCICNKNGLVKI